MSVDFRNKVWYVVLLTKGGLTDGSEEIVDKRKSTTITMKYSYLPHNLDTVFRGLDLSNHQVHHASFIINRKFVPL